MSSHEMIAALTEVARNKAHDKDYHDQHIKLHDRGSDVVLRLHYKEGKGGGFMELAPGVKPNCKHTKAKVKYLRVHGAIMAEVLGIPYLEEVGVSFFVTHGKKPY
jgi:hypothetical protein